MLFKTNTRLFLYLSSIVAVILCFSCKNKKSATVAKESLSPFALTKGNDISEVEFAAKFIEGCALRMKGNLQEALKVYEECKKMNPSDAAIYYELGMTYKILGNIPLALENAKYCAKDNPTNEWYQLLLIDCYLNSKDYKQAIKVRELLVKNFPGRFDYKEDLAIEYSLTGQNEKAFKLYDELEKTYGVNEQITQNKVKLLKNQKKFKEAENELLKLSNANKNEARFYSHLADFYAEQHDLEKAKIMYDKVLLIEPNNPMVHLDLHDYYSAKGEKEEAFNHLKKAFYNPDLDIAIKTNILGAFYKEAEQNPVEKVKGVELAKIMILIHPKSTQANGMYADFLMLDRKAKEAINYYYQAAKNEKTNYRIWDNLLLLENETRQFDSLERHSSQAIEIFPSRPINYLYNGFANSQLANYAKAVKSLKEGLEFVIDNKLLMLQFLSALGDSYNSLQEYLKSDKAFDDALKVDSDNTYVLNNYAYYLSLRNTELDKAEKLSKRSNELRPNERAYMDTYGWILYQKKKYNEAEEWLSRAAKAGPKNTPPNRAAKNTRNTAT